MSDESLLGGDEEGVESPVFLGTYDGERNDDGERHGVGYATLKRGDEYRGDYKNGKRDGHGKYAFNSRAR